MPEQIHEAPALRILCAAGEDALRIDYVFRFGRVTRDAAAQLGLDEHRIIKTLVFDNGSKGENLQALLVLMPGDCRVSLRKLEKLAQFPHLQPSTRETAEEKTGYAPGGISPFGTKYALPVFIQESLLDLDPLYINAGKRGIIARIHPSALRLLNAVYGDMTSPHPQARQL